MNNYLYIALVFALGVLAGKVINEVVTRLPWHLHRDWQCEAREILGLPEEQFPFPAFSNQHSRTRRIFVAIACGLLSAGVAYHLNLSVEGLAFIGLTWALMAAGLIDADHKLLPDIIVLPLLWAGLVVNNFDLFAASSDALWGAIIGYTSLWAVYWAFRLVTGVEGMGHGDFKLVSAIGAWGGWQILPFTVILAVLLGATIYLLKRLFGWKATSEAQTMPFGPYLSIAGWICILCSPSLPH